MRSDWWRGADAEEPGESRRLGDMVVAMVEVEGGWCPSRHLAEEREEELRGGVRCAETCAVSLNNDENFHHHFMLFRHKISQS